MKALATMACLTALATALPAFAQEPKPDPWAPVRFMVGNWRGTAAGQPGNGSVERQYEFVLGQRFISRGATCAGCVR